MACLTWLRCAVLCMQLCCEPYHKSSHGAALVKAPSAEAVLRARFAAFAKKDWKYVVSTTHPENPARR